MRSGRTAGDRRIPSHKISGPLSESQAPAARGDGALRHCASCELTSVDLSPTFCVPEATLACYGGRRQRKSVSLAARLAGVEQLGRPKIPAGTGSSAHHDCRLLSMRCWREGKEGGREKSEERRSRCCHSACPKSSPTPWGFFLLLASHHCAHVPSLLTSRHRAADTSSETPRDERGDCA